MHGWDGFAVLRVRSETTAVVAVSPRSFHFCGQAKLFSGMSVFLCWGVWFCDDSLFPLRYFGSILDHVASLVCKEFLRTWDVRQS